MDGNGYPPPVEDERRSHRDRSDRHDRDSRRERDRSDRDYRPRDDDDDRRRRDRSRERSHKSSRRSRSRDRSRERSRKSRSRSRSRSQPARRQRRRPTQWDILPEGGVLPGLPAIPAAAVPGALPGFPAPPLPGAVPDMASIAATLGLSSGLGAPGLGGAGMAGLGGLGMPSGGASTAHSQQATRHARRVYVGGLPPTATEQSVSSFFSHALAAIGGNTAGPGQSVVNVYTNKDKNFAFVEFRTVEETSNAMALDGIMFEGVAVRVRRPNDYNAAAAVGLGPAGPSPTLNLGAIGLGGGGAASLLGLGSLGAPLGGLGAVSGVGVGGTSGDPDRVFVGGLPYYLNEEQCKELLASFGAVKSFDLVKDRDTDKSKGYGFVVYADPSVTDVAVAGLNGLKMGDRTLTVRRATEGAAPKLDAALPGLGLPGMLAGMPPLPGVTLPGVALPGVALPGVALPPPPGLSGLGATSRIVVLKNAVEPGELADVTEYEEIVADMQDECNKYGSVIKLTIPRPTAEEPSPTGLGLVIIEYADMGAALQARQAMHGRKFGGHVVQGTFLTEADYAAGNFFSAS